MPRNVLPSDIPKSGERYDMTLYSVGTSKDGTFVARWMIDNGDYRGKMVSKVISEDTHDRLKPMQKKFRRSAIVRVFGLAKIGGRWVDFSPEKGKPEGATKLAYKYTLEDPLPPREPSELENVLNRTRNPFAR